jgi:hypothetical protein
MQEIKFKLWRNTEAADWSIEILGRLHSHVSTTTVDELVEYVTVAAQQALMGPYLPH